MNIPLFRTRCRSSMKKKKTLSQALSGIYYNKLKMFDKQMYRETNGWATLWILAPSHSAGRARSAHSRDVTGIGQFLTMIVSCWYLLWYNDPGNNAERRSTLSQSWVTWRHLRSHSPFWLYLAYCLTSSWRRWRSWSQGWCALYSVHLPLWRQAKIYLVW